jgi:hypothetical protein
MTNELEQMGRRTKWRYVVLAALLAACGGVTSTPTVGGESHFLKDCEDGCGSGLECISGVCTRSCLLGKDSCADLARGAVCTDASIEPGAVAVCDLACDSTLTCVKLGSDFVCEDGFCRDGIREIEPPSAGGSGTVGTAGSTSASAGSSPAGGAPNPSWEPPPRCALPFDPGLCTAIRHVYAAVDGQCAAFEYGGCEGNDNRFNTLEECLAVCQGAPSVNACPEGRVPDEICLECRPAGGCSKLMEVCALPCDAETSCGTNQPFTNFQCFENRCQQFGCE